MVKLLTSTFVTCLVYFVLVLVVSPRCCLGERLSNGQDVDTFVETKIASYDVMVFAKSYCPYCRATIKLLTELELDIPGWSFGYINLDTDIPDDGYLVQMELLQKTGQKTVPNIFIEGKHIGGNSDLQGLHAAGGLEPLLTKIAEAKEL